MGGADPGAAGIAPPGGQLLRRLPNLTVHIEADSSLTIDTGGPAIRCGHHGLAVLGAFSKPTSISDAIKVLGVSTRSAQEWMEMTSTVMSLHRAGILTDDKENETSGRPGLASFHTPPIHVAMLNDATRTSSFLAALREVIQPGDVVIDVGTGTGVLAVAAAQCGASRVYAIEAGAAARWAEAVFRANGLEDRITLIEGWSSQVELPERADVLVSETIGNEALGESVLEMVLDAQKRLLKPGGRLVPRGVKVYAVALSIPPEEVERRTFTPEGVRRWGAAYGIDFSPLVEAGRLAPFVFAVSAVVMADWQQMSAPVLLADLDLQSVQRVSLDTSTMTEATLAGGVNGVTANFELELSASTRLGFDRSGEDESSWRSLVWLLPQPHQVECGDRFNIRYRYRINDVPFNEMISLTPV